MLTLVSAAVHGAAMATPFALRGEPSPALVVELGAPLPEPASGARPAPRRRPPEPDGGAAPRTVDLPPVPDSSSPITVGADPAALSERVSLPPSVRSVRVPTEETVRPTALSRRSARTLTVRQPALAEASPPSAPGPARLADVQSGPALPGPPASHGSSGQRTFPASVVEVAVGESATAGGVDREPPTAVDAGESGVPGPRIVELLGVRSGSGARGPGSDEAGAPGGAVAAGAGSAIARATSGTLEGGATAPAARGGDESGPSASEYSLYLRRLRSRIEGIIEYPMAARRRGLAGTVRVELVLLPGGEIEHVALVGSSTHAVLDAAVLDAIRALRPPPFPPELPRRPLRVQLPIVFDFR